MSDDASIFALLTFPYVRLRTVRANLDDLRTHGRDAGSALVWGMVDGPTDAREVDLIRRRPGGLALIVILPPGQEGGARPRVDLELGQLRPLGILPFHAAPDPTDCAQVLRRPPVDLAAEVTDYLQWRGLHLERETLRLVRRILDLSGELRSISSVARSLYLSRRALGRRLAVQGLPVPSHWLQLGRLIRVAVRLQNSDATIASVAFEYGYPDGFSLSNQMERLTGHRPTEVRRRFGWEWLIEAWLRREAGTGRFSGITVLRSGAGMVDSATTTPLRRQTR